MKHHDSHTSNTKLTHPSVPETWASLSSLAELITPKSTNRTAFLEECRSGALDGVKICYRTAQSVSITGLFDTELVNALPSTLTFCCSLGAGYDQIDVSACSARQPLLRVSNTPTAVDDATADTAVFLILGALRGFNSSMQALRRKEWRGNPMPPLGHDPEGKVLGILGMGGIGRNMMKKCEAFGMKTIHHNRRRLDEKQAGGAEWVEFEELLARSDVLSLNLPLNVCLPSPLTVWSRVGIRMADNDREQPKTRHIISTGEFAKMKKGIIVSTQNHSKALTTRRLTPTTPDCQHSPGRRDRRGRARVRPGIRPGLIRGPRRLRERAGGPSRPDRQP